MMQTLAKGERKRQEPSTEGNFAVFGSTTLTCKAPPSQRRRPKPSKAEHVEDILPNLQLALAVGERRYAEVLVDSSVKSLQIDHSESTRLHGTLLSSPLEGPTWDSRCKIEVYSVAWSENGIDENKGKIRQARTM